MYIKQSIDQVIPLKLQLHFIEAKTWLLFAAEMKLIILIGIFAATALGEHMYPVVIKFILYMLH